MTVAKLIKMLEKLPPRAKVVVDKESLWDGNGTFTISNVESLEYEFVNLCDGDGFTEFRKDGSEKGSFQAILKGGK